MVTNLTGQRFGQLIVTGYAGKINRLSYYYCECDCGIESLARGTNLTAGTTKSCGFHKQKHPTKYSSHGMTKSSEYGAWMNIKRIEGVKNAWKNFNEFIEDVGYKPTKSHTLARKNTRLPHGPNNTYWRDPNAKRTDKIKPAVLDLRAILRGTAAA